MRGPGRVQRMIAAAFTREPARIHTAVSLAGEVYSTEAPTRMQLKAVRRAADPIAQSIGWARRTIKGQVQYLHASKVTRSPSNLSELLKGQHRAAAE